MGEFTWITLSLLFLQISAEVTEENVFVRNGSDATLPCGNVMDGQHECNGTTWNFVRKETAEELVGHGKIKPEFQSDRLAVTADCSLLIKNVTKEDANQYTCQQYRYNPIKGVHRYGGDAKVYLSVVTLTEHQDTDKRMFNCSVWTYKQCKHKVRWQFEKNNEKKYKQDSSTVDGICSNTTTCLGCKSKNSDSLTCEVTDTNQKVYPFPFKSSDQKTVSGFPDWAKFFIASGLAALLVTTVVLLIWNRKKGEKTQMGEGTVVSKNLHNFIAKGD